MVASFHGNMRLTKGNGRTLGSQRVLYEADSGDPELPNIRWQEKHADGWRDFELDSPTTGGGGPAPGSGNLIPSTTIHTSAFTARAGYLEYVDSSGGAFTAALPAGPANGTRVGVMDVADAWEANPVLLAPGAGDTVLDTNGLSCDDPGGLAIVQHVTETHDWRLVDNGTIVDTPGVVVEDVAEALDELGHLSVVGKPGIDPTGTTSSTAGLQALIDQAYNGGNPIAEIFISPGNYKITDHNADGIGLIIPSGVLVKGAGYGTRLFATTAIEIVKYVNGLGTWRKAGLRDLFIDGTDVATIGFHEMMAAYSDHAGLLVNNCDIGMLLDGAQNCTYLGCQANYNSRNLVIANGAGSLLLLCCGVNFGKSINIELVNDPAFTETYPLLGGGLLYSSPTQCSLFGGVYERDVAGMVHGLKLTHGEQNSFINVVFSNPGSAGLINIEAGANLTLFDNCTFFGNGGTDNLIDCDGYGTIFRNPKILNHQGDIFNFSNFAEVFRPNYSLASGKVLMKHRDGGYASIMHLKLEVHNVGGGDGNRPDGPSLGAVVRFFNFGTFAEEVWNPVLGSWRLSDNSITAAAKPTAGYWTAGTRCWNLEPAVGEPIGWVCVVTGVPGTWATMETLV